MEEQMMNKFKKIKKGKNNAIKRPKIVDKQRLLVSTVSAVKLCIGRWEFEPSRNEDELVVRDYFVKKQLSWEVLRNGRREKIEIEWSNIVGIRALMKENKPGLLEVELSKPPKFYKEVDNIERRAHDKWVDGSDFTEDEAASKCRRHLVIFPSGMLNKQFEKWMSFDERLCGLIQKPFPTFKFLYFDNNSETTFPAASLDQKHLRMPSFGVPTQQIQPSNQTLHFAYADPNLVPPILETIFPAASLQKHLRMPSFAVPTQLIQPSNQTLHFSYGDGNLVSPISAFPLPSHSILLEEATTFGSAPTNLNPQQQIISSSSSIIGCSTSNDNGTMMNMEAPPEEVIPNGFSNNYLWNNNNIDGATTTDPNFFDGCSSFSNYGIISSNDHCFPNNNFGSATTNLMINPQQQISSSSSIIIGCSNNNGTMMMNMEEAPDHEVLPNGFSNKHLWNNNIDIIEPTTTTDHDPFLNGCSSFSNNNMPSSSYGISPNNNLDFVPSDSERVVAVSNGGADLQINNSNTSCWFSNWPTDSQGVWLPFPYHLN